MIASATENLISMPAYRHRRFQNWIIIGFMYSFFYMSRYNFSAIAPTLQTFFGWTKSNLGVFETLLPLVYGLSVVINGPIADKIGGRKAFLIGAVGVVIMNGLFGFLHILVQTPAIWADREIVAEAVLQYGLTKGAVLWLLAIIWAINGYFQSFGALSIVKINAQWFHIRERGTFSAIFGVLIRFGLILAFSGTPLIVKFLPWYWAFWIPAMVVAILFVLTIFFVRDTPAAAGYPELDTGDGTVNYEEKVKFKEVLAKVFGSKIMWTIAIGSMMIGFVRRGVVDAWWPVYYKEMQGIAGVDFAFQLTAWGIAILGIIGGFAFGISSDRVFKGRRAPVIVIGFCGMVVVLILFFLADLLHLGAIAAAILLASLSFFVNGSHGMIGGAATMDFGGRKAAATAVGLIDGMQYLAGAFVGMLVGWVTTNWGWQAWKLWPIPFAIVGALVMSRLWHVLPKGKSSH
ncbi:MAG: MFS transporter [Candidatus Marinimicrobia bacterium]|jgi:OPA family glycerol-3-phosphate transporter-like MFS transporter|nr:MFS transporter [Candidatus Neomarinimicrobiota bacterium]